MDSEKFVYFMKRTEQDLEHIRTKVDSLWDFRAMVLGGALVVSIISSALVSVLMIAFGGR